MNARKKVARDQKARKSVYVKHEVIDLGRDSGLDEKWVQDKIALDPSILGLGDVIVKDRERIQPKAGRLDFLLQSSDNARRYEVEVQLGRADESHIIRTIEYWDLEKKKNPNYDHVAVIVAEDITRRFLNVINLFNGTVPIIALQMKAIKIDNKVTLIFTRVIDEFERGSEEDEIMEVTDRAYWETERGTQSTVALADQMLGWIREFFPDSDLKYNKFYIGVASDGQPNNFVIFRPQKDGIRVEIRLPQDKKYDVKIQRAKQQSLDYDVRWKRYRLKVYKEDLKRNKKLIVDLLKVAFEEANG